MNPEPALAITPPAEVSASPCLPLSASSASTALGDVIAIGVGRYAIPASDTLPDGPWSKLKQDERNRVNTLLECFRLMEAAPNLRKEAEALAFRFKGVRGYSEGSLVNLYYAWRESGWLALRKGHHVNKSKLPPAFLEFWRALCEQHGRSIITALDALRTRWFAGQDVPGYGTWIDWWHRTHPLEDAPRVCPGTPEGWSKTTLYDLGPTKIERELATRGLAAVRPLLPSLIRDTSKLLPLQLLTMDDFETDQDAFCKNPRTGEWQLVKVTGLAVMDVATRRVIALLMKPRFRDQDGKQEAITRAEVRLLFFQVLRDYGIPHCGMTWLVENAAAAITSELELTTRNLFGDRVQIRRTGLLHDKVFSNGFIERGGKPQQKGWIESRFNLVHNAADALPGQKGAMYLSKPGDHEAKKQYAEHLLGQGRDDAKLSDEQIARLHLPFKHADELIAFYMSELFPKLDQRVEHKMGGFELLRRWRRDEHDTWHEWEELATLPREERATLQWFPRELRESSRMRWDRLFPQVKIEKVAEHVLMMLLLTPRHAKMRKTGVTFQHNGKGYSFADKRALPLRIAEGTDVLCYFDPARPHNVHICDLEGRHLVELRSLHVDITNPAEMDDATAHISALYNSILSTVRGRPLHQAADQKLLEDRQHNAAIEAENVPALPAGDETPQIEAEAPAPVSPVRKYVAKKNGLTQSLARDNFAPRATVHTPTGEAFAQTVIASETDRAEQLAREQTAAALEAERVARGAAQALEDYD